MSFVKISFGSIIGCIAGITLFVIAILMDDPKNPFVFLDPKSILIVMGGTLAATFIAFKEIWVIKAFRGFLDTFKHLDINSSSLYDDVGKVITWSEMMKKGGLSELQDKFDDKEYLNPVIKYGMDMVFTGFNPEEIEKYTENFIENIHERNYILVDVLETMATYTPAFGMIGTLIGLVTMLGNMDDPDMIGPAMALALITTLWGVFIAYLILKPAAKNLSQKYDIIRYRDTLLMQGMVWLADKKHPYIIQGRLNSYLDPSNHFDIAER